jgi:hypothetical protein
MTSTSSSGSSSSGPMITDNIVLVTGGGAAHLGPAFCVGEGLGGNDPSVAGSHQVTLGVFSTLQSQ